MKLLADIAILLLIGGAFAGAAYLVLWLWYARRPTCPWCGEWGHARCTGWLPIDPVKVRESLRREAIAAVARDMEESPVDPRAFRIEPKDLDFLRALRRMGPPT